MTLFAFDFRFYNNVPDAVLLFLSYLELVEFLGHLARMLLSCFFLLAITCYKTAFNPIFVSDDTRLQIHLLALYNMA